MDTTFIAVVLITANTGNNPAVLRQENGRLTAMHTAGYCSATTETTTIDPCHELG